jgi:hypothetical protein
LERSKLGGDEPSTETTIVFSVIEIEGVQDISVIVTDGFEEGRVKGKELPSKCFLKKFQAGELRKSFAQS